MNRVLALILTFAVASSLVADNKKLWKAHDPIPNEYIVVLSDQTGTAIDGVVNGLAAQHNGTVLAVLRHGVKAFGVRLTADQADRMASSPLVDHIEENARGFLSYTVQEFGYQGTDASWWHLDRIDNQGPLYPYHAYAYTSSGANVNVYVLDTGVLGTHEEFSIVNGTRVRTGATFGDGYAANNPCPTLASSVSSDNASHGTAVASVIGGTNNGVAKNVTIIPVKVFNCDPNTGFTQSSLLWFCWGLDWILGDAQSFANAQYRAVVNISGGAPVSNAVCDDGHGGVTPCIPALENNVANLVHNGITVVAAANNNNNANCDTSPARMGYGGTAGFGTIYHTITVGGSDETDQRWVRTQSETNPNAPQDTGSNFGTCVDIYAPAHNFMHLASLPCNTCYHDNSNLFSLSGTSFSAPVVTGMVARLLQAHPTWAPEVIWNYIRDHATAPNCFDWQDIAHTVCPNSRLAYMSPYD